MPTSAATASAARRLSPVSSTGRSPSRRSSAIAAALVGFTVSATTTTPRDAPSQPTRTAVRPAASARIRGVTQRGVERHRPVGEEALPAGDDGVPVDDAGHAEALRAGEALDRGEVEPASRAPAAIGAGDRVLGRVLQRTGQPQHLVASLPSAGTTSTSAIVPGGHGARLVEHDRVDAPGRLEHLGSLDEDAELGAAAGADHDRRRRGQTEGARAGDDQHGDGGRERDGRRPRRCPSQKPSVPTARAMTIGTNTAEIRSARRCTGALPALGVLDEAGDLGQLGVGADPRRPHDEPAAGVDGGTGDGVARPDLDRHRLAGEQRGVDRRRAVLDDAVGGDLLARPHDEAVADGELLDRDALLDAVAEDGDVLGAELEQRPQRGAGAALGPGLEVAAGEDERRDAGGDLEVDQARAHLPVGGAARTRASCRARRRRRGTARTATTRRRRARRSR